MNGEGNANRDLLQQGWRGRPKDGVDLVGFLLKPILRAGGLARQLRRRALVEQGVDDLVGEFEPRIGGEARYGFIQYGLDRADALAAASKDGLPLAIAQGDSMIDELLNDAGFRQAMASGD